MNMFRLKNDYTKTHFIQISYCFSCAEKGIKPLAYQKLSVSPRILNAWLVVFWGSGFVVDEEDTHRRAESLAIAVPSPWQRSTPARTRILPHHTTSRPFPTPIFPKSRGSKQDWEGRRKTSSDSEIHGRDDLLKSKSNWNGAFLLYTCGKPRYTWMYVFGRRDAEVTFLNSE